LRGKITDITSERTAFDASITIKAREIPIFPAATTHAAPPIARRGLDLRGRRTLTCAVDSRIRPGHTIQEGSETWTVGATDYRIHPHDAVMEITEDG